MANLNLVLVRQGYAPLPRVAETLSKHRTTIHRMVDAGYIKAVPDGHSRYVELTSLLMHYMNNNNKPMVEAVNKLGQQLQRELLAAEAREVRKASPKAKAP